MQTTKVEEQENFKRNAEKMRFWSTKKANKN